VLAPRLVGALALAAVGAGCRATPDFARVAPSAAFPDDVPQPVFVMDARDAAENPILAVFLGPGADRREITVVFEDETPPYRGVQTLFLSEPIRFALYRRRADVESFAWIPAAEAGGRFAFEGSWGGDQAFRALWPGHPSATVELDDLDRLDGRPVVYVTTWNHLFHARPQGLAGRETIPIADYPVYDGSRASVEALFRGSTAGPAAEDGGR
jgi:hypothetical protein